MTPLGPEDAKAAAAEAKVLTQFADLNVFRVLLRHPRIAKVLNDLLLTLLGNPKLSDRLRELVVMRIGWVTSSVYEWTSHWPIALGTGLTEDEIVGVRDWRSHAGFTDADRAVLAATDETIETGAVSRETWRECEAHVEDEQALIELVVAIGNWRMFSSLLRTLEVPLEDGVAPWPPDGTAGPNVFTR